jgi:hypothetical protein
MTSIIVVAICIYYLHLLGSQSKVELKPVRIEKDKEFLRRR